jgi:hypothetical protein
MTVTRIDAEQLLGALSFTLELNGEPVLVDPDGVIYIGPYGSTFRRYVK